jgi:GNAT superfamily N-acetyltransferase
LQRETISAIVGCEMQLDAETTERTLPGGDADICVRPLERTDRRAYLAAFERLSPTTRYLRFAAPKPRLTSADLALLLDIDHDRHEALVAYACATGEPAAVARYVRDADDRASAEMAITVVDGWQGRGIGPRLLAELSARAAAHGLTRLHADGLMATLERPLS